MADNKGQSTKKPTDSQKKLQESQAQVDEVGISRDIIAFICLSHNTHTHIAFKQSEVF